MFELPPKRDQVLEEKWMFVIKRCPNGQSYPIRFFKVGADYIEKKEKPKESPLKVELDESEEL